MQNDLSKTILHNIGDGILAVDPQLNIVFANYMTYKILRINESEEVIGKPVEQFLRLSIDQSSELEINPFLFSMLNGESKNYSIPMLVKSISDETVYISDSVSPIRNVDSEIIGSVMTFRDVSNDVKMINLLNLSNQRYEFLFNSIKSGVAVYTSVDGINFFFSDLNASAEIIDGVNKKDIIGKKIEEVFNGAEELGLLKLIKKTWKTGESSRLPCSLYKDKVRHSWRDNYIYKLPSGEIVVVYEDVTDKKRKSEHVSDVVGKLRSDFKRFSNVFNNSGIGIIVLSKSPDFNIENANLAFCDFIGYTQNELIGMPIQKITFPQDWSISVYNDDLVNRLPSFSKAVTFYKRYIAKNGLIKWGSVFLTKIEHDDGEIEYVSQVIDITQQKKAESERKLLVNVVKELNASDMKNKDTIKNIMQNIKEVIMLDSVAVRLPQKISKENQQVNDYTFYYHDGFNDDFVNNEKSLYCSDDESNNQLDCVCGLVISGKTNPNLEKFTENGSFWTNNMSNSLNKLNENDISSIKRRQSCWERGHESMAIIPIISGDSIVGSMLLTANRKEAFEESTINFLEEIGKAMGVAFSRMQLRTDIENSRRALSRANDILAIESDFAQNIAGYSTESLENMLAKVGKKLNFQWISAMIVGDTGITERWTDNNGSSCASFEEKILISTPDNMDIKKWVTKKEIYTGERNNLPECLKKISPDINGTWIAIPILNNKIQSPTGIVIMVSKNNYEWSQDEKKAMEGFATLICIIAKTEKNRVYIKRKIEETILTISHGSSPITEAKC